MADTSMPGRRIRGITHKLAALSTLIAIGLAGCSGEDAPDRPNDARDGRGPAPAEAADARPAPDAPRPTAAAWLLVDESDPVEGPTVEVARAASRGTNSVGISPTLHLRCRSDTTDVYIVWYEDPEGEDNDVTTQLDEERPVRRTWQNVNEDANLFPRDSAAVFLDRLLTADSLTVRSNLYKRMPVTAVFDLAGLPEAIAPVRAACGE